LKAFPSSAFTSLLAVRALPANLAERAKKENLTEKELSEFLGVARARVPGERRLP
jgi:hypothetical protein